MSDPFLALNGIIANSARLHTPNTGRWVLDVSYNGTEAPAGAALVVIGSLSFVGAIVPQYTGAFLGQVKARVIAGAGAWGNLVTAKSYHDDGGVRRTDVIAALARDTGETVDVSTDNARLGVDFVRLNEPAVAVLDSLVPSWRVDYDGVTRYLPRPAASLASAELLEVDYRAQLFTFGIVDPSAVPIGAEISDARLAVPYLVHEVEFHLTPGTSRAIARGVPA